MKGAFGSGQRLSTRGFVVLGLLTVWVYPALRFAAEWRSHLRRRWTETAANADIKASDPRLPALRATGFSAGVAAPSAAVALFAAAAALVAWIVAGRPPSVLAAVAGAAALFYGGTLVLMLWALKSVRRHESLELLVRERGAAALLQAPEPGEDRVRRWDAQAGRVAAFLVAAFLIAFSVAFGTQLHRHGFVWGHELVVPALAAALAAAYHLWGSALLAALYNGHLREEARHAAATDAPPRREHAAIMLTDMQDYSKAMRADESGAFALLQDHNRLMRAAIAAHRGREIKTIGDAFLVLFASPLDAVECAFAAQRAFADYNMAKPAEQKILVRIGIHLGDVLVTASDVFGDGVNVAARIEPLAAPGGICVSDAVLKSIQKELLLHAEPVKRVKLKNIASPPKLYRILPA